MNTEPTFTGPIAAIDQARAAIAAVETATPGEEAVKALLEVHLEEGVRLAGLMELLRRQRTWSACTWHLEIRHYRSRPAARQALAHVPEQQRAGLVDFATGDTWAEEEIFPWVAALVSGGVDARRKGNLEMPDPPCETLGSRE